MEEEKVIHARVVPDDIFEDKDADVVAQAAYDLAMIRKELHELNRNMKDLIKVEKSKK